MNFIEWDDTAIVNHEAMDKDHKRMVEDINKLHTFVSSNNVDKTNKLLDKIIEDLKTHFDNEHELMVKSKTPKYISHKLEHERFYSKIRNLQLKINSGKETLSIDDLKVVKIWFQNHMNFKDRPLANYLNEHNIK